VNGRVLFEAYIAVACLITLAAALAATPRLLRARQQAVDGALTEARSREELRQVIARASTTGDSSLSMDVEFARAGLAGAIKGKTYADESYRTESAYTMLLGGVFVAHILALGVTRFAYKAGVKTP